MARKEKMTMRYISICSGIEAATAAWHPLGWHPVAFAEIEPFPCAVLAHHYPNVPNLGDFTTIVMEQYRGTVDLVVGGTPCQAFSVAGLRRGLDDPRGNLTLAFLRLLADIRPRWVVWENVPGVLSIDRGRVFGAFLGGLAQLGYGFAYRILDAQYFGVPQRRRRVFVVGHLGDWRRAAAVLFERHSLSGNPAPSREAGKEITRTIALGSFADSAGGDSNRPSRGHSTPDVAACLRARANSSHRADADTYIAAKPLLASQGQRMDPETENLIPWPVDIAPTLNAAFGAKQGLEDQHALGGAGLFVPCSLAIRGREGGGTVDGYFGFPAPAHAFKVRCGCKGGGKGYLGSDDTAFTLSTGTDQHLQHGMSVRRLTPRECERLQGFPDDYTRIAWRNKPATACPDGPRYKALGNSMAVPVMRWIGERIQSTLNTQIKNQKASTACTASGNHQRGMRGSAMADNPQHASTTVLRSYYDRMYAFGTNSTDTLSPSERDA